MPLTIVVLWVAFRQYVNTFTPISGRFQLLIRCKDHHRRGTTQLSDVRHHPSWPSAIRNLHTQYTTRSREDCTATPYAVELSIVE